MKKALKRIGIAVGSLGTLALIFYAVVYFNIGHRISKTYAFQQETILIPTDSVTLAHGTHLVAIKGCTDCHGKNMAGKVMISDGGLGTLTAPNLTKGIGGLPNDYNTVNWLTALRHGVNKQGKPLLLMPSHESALLKQKDMAAIIAYCQQLEPVNNELPPTKIGPVVRLMTFLGKMPLLSVEMIDHGAPMTGDIAAGNLIAEGKYLAISCKGCHRDNMQGGAPLAPGFPEVPNITALGPSGSWTHAQFTTMLRTGKTPAGRQIDNENMPWKMTAQYTDEEITALYTYLHSLK